MTEPTPETTGERTGERIAKLLARAGVASRREIERMIAEGRVMLNDAPVTTPATLLTSLAGVTVDGKPVAAPVAARIFRFHKPSGLITAERDPAGRPTIYTALRNALPLGTPRMMPVGRLDLNTEGLLLLTNDGELKRALELPKSGIPRTYRARTFGEISQARLEELMEGIEIDGVRYGPINANLERSAGHNKWIELTLAEGKNREVRRVLEHLGLQVSRLLRLAYGPFLLGDLLRGAAMEVDPVSVEKFRATLDIAPEKFERARPVREPLTAAPSRDPKQQGARPATFPAQGRDDAKPKPARKPAPRRRSDDGVLVDRPKAARPPAKKPGKGWARAKPKPGAKPRKPKGPRA
jgi:23S rRNA pseudouridine2605 synthase